MKKAFFLLKISGTESKGRVVTLKFFKIFLAFSFYFLAFTFLFSSSSALAVWELIDGKFMFTNSHPHRLKRGKDHTEIHALNKKFSMLVWNIKKEDFVTRLKASKKFPPLQNIDLILVQEGDLSNKELFKSLSSFSKNFKYQWNLAKAWNHFPVGVMSLSKAPAEESLPLLSRGDFGIGYKKSSLLQRFRIQGQKKPLLVINSHLLLFSSAETLRAQVEEIKFRIALHGDGPVVWAGDFNTWHEGTQKLIVKTARQLGLQVASKDLRPVKDISDLPQRLDQILFKNLKLKELKFFTSPAYEDFHIPMKVVFEA